jgi:CubicO group peptidase (beta-lactamase class C family)
MGLRGLLLYGLIAVLVGCGGGEKQEVERTDLPHRLDAELAKRGEELGVPGAAAALYRRGELVWSGGWGKADIEADRPMTAQTPVAYASVGKMITAALALRLAEQGRLSLDDPVRRWVPAWPGARSKTLRDLLGHDGGIEDAPERFYLAQIRWPARTFTPAAWLAAIRPPHPEDSDVYNNSGFVVAGLALKRAAGDGWLDLLHDTAPGLALQPDQRVQGEPARGYVYPRGAGDPRPFGDDGPFVPSTSLATAAWTSGGYAGSAEAMASWADRLFAGEVIDEDSLSQMTDFRPSTAIGDSYGLGLGHFEVEGREAWGHQGGMPGFHTDLTHVPAEGLTLFAVWNDDLISQSRIPQTLLEVALTYG